MFTRIAKSFLIWRVALFVIAFFSIYLFPSFGGRFPYYDTVLQVTGLPGWIWGFGNFDGVHYLKIAQEGYLATYSQAFFPFFPLLIRIINVFPKNVLLDTRVFVDPTFFYTGFVLANALFLGFLVTLYKLVRLDYPKKIALLSVLFILFFPTSFYFGSIYTESLFGLLAVGSVYLFRKERYVWAGVVAGLASFTRIFGLFIPLIFLIEGRKNFKKAMPSIILGMAGFLAYAFYLNSNFGDPLLFLNAQPAFGAERSSMPVILLPQVLYRYINILANVDFASFAFFNALLELMFTIVPLTLILIYHKKIRPSYFWFSLLVLIVPTLTGTLSSMPRYVLSAFAIFPLMAVLLERHYKYVLAVFAVIQIVLLSMFIRGYWVA